MSRDHSLESLLGAARRDVLDGEAVSRVRVGLETAGVGVVAVKWWSSVGAKLIATTLVGGALAIGGYLAIRSPEEVAVAAPTTIPMATLEVEPAPPEPIVVAAPLIETIATVTPVKHVAPPARAAITAAPTQTSAREGLLLLRARAVLATDPQRALELVREHTTEFPTSQLGPERDKLRHDAETKGAH